MTMASKIVAIGIIVFVAVGIIFALGTIPASAFKGGSPVTVCNLSLMTTGVYNDNGIAHWITDFNVAYSASGCHQQTLLDMLPNSPAEMNLFPFTFSFAITLLDSQGISHCDCKIGIDVPALQTAYSFSGSIKVANVPLGSYTLNIYSPFPFNSAQGSTTYSEQVVVSES